MAQRSTSFSRVAQQGQARFRDTSPTISPQGRMPTDDKGLRNPHLLALGSEEENLYPGIRRAGGAVEFFRRRSIKLWKSSRSGDDSRTGPPATWQVPRSPA